MFGLVQGEANAIQPRKRPLSSMTPTIVLRTASSTWWWARPAARRIINTVLQVILNVLDFGMNVQEAVDWPRFHHQWMPDELRLERGLLARHRGAARGARAHRSSASARMGEVAAILMRRRVAGRARPDARAEGTAEGY